MVCRSAGRGALTGLPVVVIDNVEMGAAAFNARSNRFNKSAKLYLGADTIRFKWCQQPGEDRRDRRRSDDDCLHPLQGRPRTPGFLLCEGNRLVHHEPLLS